LFYKSKQMSNKQDIHFLTLAIANSQKSYDQGNFPAGAVVVKNGKIITEAVNDPFPNLLHADSKAVKKAFEKYGPLSGATLYIGIESCLMCFGVAFWAGISRIVYAIPKSKVSPLYYETGEDTGFLISKMNRKIEMLHMPELESEALAIIRKWEEKIINRK